jgi:hypothetical protein
VGIKQKYRYKRLPMGIKNSPDIFQAVINDLLGDLDFVQVYLDDIPITSSGSFQDHLQKLHIVETLKEFRNILFGQQIVVHTDHRNILYKKLSNDRIIRWRLLLEEYGPEYVYVSGKDNVVADALSRMEADFNINEKEFEKDQNAYAQMCGCMIS